jgi:hypothetical protein
MQQTAQEYRSVISTCKKVFIDKTTDYGTAWRILRLPSITDQIFIKAQRIRSIQEKGTMLVQEDISSEFMGIINYSIIALIQMEMTPEDSLELSPEKVSELYDKHASQTLDLLMKKNHD